METCDNIVKPIIRRKAGKGNTPSGVSANNFMSAPGSDAAVRLAHGHSESSASSMKTKTEGKGGGGSAKMKNDCSPLRETTGGAVEIAIS